MNNNLETVSCIICGSETYFTISENRKSTFPINLVLCDTCGLAYLNPRWDKARYSQYYQSEYDKTYRSNLQKGDNILKPKTNSIVKRIEKSGLSPKKVLKILEIGSGNGQNLIDLKAIYPNAELYAIEPSIVSQKIMLENGISLLSDDVDNTWETDYINYFDLIIMRHVLEHFLEPCTILKKVNGVLNDFGVVYIAVPNNLSTNRNHGWLRIAHTYYFNVNSLSNLLIKEHFEPLLVQIGDRYNNTEIFTFSKKANENKSLKIDQNFYYQQKNIFNKVLKKEKTLWYKFEVKIKKVIWLVKNTLVNHLG